MTSRPKSNPFGIEVKFERRDDGGLRASCERVPSFFLSHSDPNKVVADIIPALRVILSAMFGVPVDVQRLVDIGEAYSADPVMPAYLCSAQNYVGLSRGH